MGNQANDQDGVVDFDFRFKESGTLAEMTRTLENAEAEGFKVKLQSVGAGQAEITVRVQGLGWTSADAAADALKKVVRAG